ncbi:MAG: hypothetical protein ACI8RD_004812 [Bacillariaceae sp.]|jgi:hypothetical protein
MIIITIKKYVDAFATSRLEYTRLYRLQDLAAKLNIKHILIFLNLSPRMLLLLIRSTS